MATHISIRLRRQFSISILLLLSVLYLKAQESFISTWKTDHPGTSDSTSITIPVYSTSEYAYDVDWNNDGIFDEFEINDSITHDFGAVGTYTIRIRGVFPRIYFKNEGDKDKLLDISQWGSAIQWASMDNAFSSCSNLTISAVDAPDLSQVTSMKSMFKNCTALNSNLEHWDVSTVQNFYFAFSFCSNFNQPLNNWDMSSAINLNKMFQGAKVFNQPLNNWEVGNVTNFGALFHECTAFDQPLEDWDVGSATTMALMFGSAFNFNQDISNWNVSNNKNFSGMFNYASLFNQAIDGWDMSNATNMDKMFANATSFNQYIGDWEVGNVTNMRRLFIGASSFDQDIGGWDVSKVTMMNWMFFYATSFSHDISDWDVSSVTNMSNMFKGASAFNHDISNWDVSEVTTMASMFEENIGFDQNLGDWNVSKVKSMDRMFNLADLSTANYDNLLLGWSNLTLQDSVILGVDSRYCSGWRARADLRSNFNWIIDDKGADNTPPAVFCKNITVQLDENGSATISPEALDDGSFGHCTDLMYTASKTIFDCDDLGELLDTFTIHDMLANEATCVANVQIIDAAFNFNCPSDFSVTPNSSECQANVFWDDIHGNCDVAVTSNHHSGDLFSLGTTTVTYTAVDGLQNTSTCSFEVTVSNDLAINLDNIQNPSCHNSTDGQISISITGGLEPYSFDWNNDGFGDNDDLEDLPGLEEGTYQLILSDELGCSVHSAMIDLTQPEPLTLHSTVGDSPNSSGILIDLSVIGGTAPYQYDWDDDGIGDFDDPEDIEVEEEGIYKVVTKDQNECTSSTEVQVIINSASTLFQQHDFQISPNPSRGVITLERGDCRGKATINIFDPRGVKVFSQSISTCQTEIALQDLPKGTYFLRLNSDRGAFIKAFVMVEE